MMMQAFLRKTNDDLNMDRYYSIETVEGLFGFFGVERRWGRRGTSGQCRIDWYDAESIAIKEAASLSAQKQAKGYKTQTITL